MILNAERINARRLSSDQAWKDFIDTIDDLQRQIAERDTYVQQSVQIAVDDAEVGRDRQWAVQFGRIEMDPEDVPSVMQQRVDAAVLTALREAAELPEKIYPRDSVFGLLKQNILAIAARSRVQGKSEPAKGNSNA